MDQPTHWHAGPVKMPQVKRRIVEDECVLGIGQGLKCPAELVEGDVADGCVIGSEEEDEEVIFDQDAGGDDLIVALFAAGFKIDDDG